MLAWIRNSTDDTRRNAFLHADPLTRLLLVRFRLKVWVATLLILIVPVLPLYLIVFARNLYIIDSQSCAYHNIFYPLKCLKIGLSSDYGWFWYQFISWPVTILFFLWFPKGILKALEGLRGNGVLVIPPGVPEPRDALSKFTSQFASSYSRPIWLVASLIALVAFMCFNFLPDQMSYIVWTTSDWFVFGYTQLFHSFMLLTVFLIAIRASIAVFWFNRLFRKFDIDVNFLHPDKAGGLMPFGSLLVKGSYFIGIYGCTLMVLIMEAPYREGTIDFGQIVAHFSIQRAVIPMAVLYFLFAPTLFFSALWSAHSKMTEARNNLVLKIANQYKDKIHCLDSSLGCSNLSDVKGNTEVIEQLKKAHAIASDCPIWPINTGNVFRFFTSYLAPVAFALSLALIMKLLNLS